MAEPQTIEAVYENGVLRPLQTLVGLAEHSKVKITIEYQETLTHPLLQFAGILSDQEAAELQSVIDQEFEQIDQDGWRNCSRHFNSNSAWESLVSKKVDERP